MKIKTICWHYVMDIHEPHEIWYSVHIMENDLYEPDADENIIEKKMINYNTVLHILTMDIEQIPTHLYVDDIHNPEGTWYSIQVIKLGKLAQRYNK